MKASQLLVGAIVTGAVWAAYHLPVDRQMPPLAGAREWLNSPPLTPAGLRGKVVVVNFWTYTCINWLRQLPHVRGWAARYKDQGLVVIGVHSPEFAFEKDLDSVRRAAKDLRVDYPIAIDNDHVVWRAFTNEYWPALYIVDASGRVRHQQFGEGRYAETETIIRQLLAEAGTPAAGDDLAPVDARGVEAPADWTTLKSPENYVGYVRTENFASPGGAVQDRPHVYTVPTQLRLNRWALAGEWSIEAGATVLKKAGGRIAYRFHARDLHLVLALPADQRPVRFRITIDGAPPGAQHGADVDADGWGTLRDNRLYQLVRQTRPIEDRTFTIEFFDAGPRAYAFTFG